jgi:site-specific recombinase XerD
VDFQQKFIYLDRTKNECTRFVHLNSAALQVLKGLRKEHNRLKLPADGTLFLSQWDGEIKNPRKWFETALYRAGIHGVTWHTLRHTFVSRLAMTGVDLRTVQELMGHKTIAMTVRYSHLAPAHPLSALELLVTKAVK